MSEDFNPRPGQFDPERFHCVRCGKCCRWRGIVKVTDKEVDAIAGFLGMQVDAFLDSMTRLSPDRMVLSLIEKDDGSCYFYDEEHRICLIQPAKPAQCLAFPYRWNFPGWENVCEGGKRMKD